MCLPFISASRRMESSFSFLGTDATLFIPTLQRCPSYVSAAFSTQSFTLCPLCLQKIGHRHAFQCPECCISCCSKCAAGGLCWLCRTVMDNIIPDDVFEKIVERDLLFSPCPQVIDGALCLCAMALLNPGMRMSLISQYQLVESLAFLFEAFSIELLKRQQGQGSSPHRSRVGRTCQLPTLSNEASQKVVTTKAKRSFLEELDRHKHSRGDSVNDKRKLGAVLISKGGIIFSCDLVRTVSLLLGVIVNASAPTEYDSEVFGEECCPGSIPLNISLTHSTTNLAKRVKLLVKHNIPTNMFRIAFHMFNDMCSSADLLLLIMWALRNMSVCDDECGGIFGSDDEQSVCAKGLSHEDTHVSRDTCGVLNGTRDVATSHGGCNTTNSVNMKKHATDTGTLQEALINMPGKIEDKRSWREFVDANAGGIFSCQIDEFLLRYRKKGREVKDTGHNIVDMEGDVICEYYPYSSVMFMRYHEDTMLCYVETDGITIPSTEYRYIYREHVLSLLGNLHLSSKNSQIINTIIEQTLTYMLDIGDMSTDDMMKKCYEDITQHRKLIQNNINIVRSMIDITRIILYHELESVTPKTMYLCFVALVEAMTNEDNAVLWASVCLRLLIKWSVDRKLALPKALLLKDRVLLTIVTHVYDIEDGVFVNEVLSLLEVLMEVQEQLRAEPVCPELHQLEKTQTLISQRSFQAAKGILLYSIPASFRQRAERLIQKMAEIYKL